MLSFTVFKPMTFNQEITVISCDSEAKIVQNSSTVKCIVATTGKILCHN